MNSPRWRIQGEWQDSCNCNVGCPCNYHQLPTHGFCQGIIAYHIEEGSFGDTSLNGLTVVKVVKYEPGLPGSTRWEGGFIIDASANQAQREALRRIFSGEAGGRFAPTSVLAKSLGIEYHPILWRHGKEGWGLGVTGRVASRAEAYKGPDTPTGEVVQLLNAPISEGGPGQPITIGHATESKVRAFGLEFDHRGCNSKFGPARLSGP